MNKLSVTVLLASMLTVFANADSQKDVEIAKEVGRAFGEYVVLQEAMLDAENRIGTVKEILFTMPSSENFEFGESKSPMGIYAIAKKTIGKCPKGGKWLITSHEKNGNLKFKCQIDAGCESLTPNLKSVCEYEVNQNASSVEEGIMKDSRDGKAYKTVKFSNVGQTWMAENLNYKIEGSRCLLDKKANCKKYGRLYTWNAAMKACPTGWRVPDSRDWIGLFIEAGWDGKLKGPKREILEIGGKLKSKSGWRQNGTDDLKFSVLPGGLVLVKKNIFLEGEGVLWSSEVNQDGMVWGCWFFNDRDDISTLWGSKDNFLSVRCVKDE
jgi:uncharacterized protein (TIGR02145 family)